MNRMLAALFDSGTTLPAVLCTVTLLLGCAALAATALRRQSAATRHFVWTLALAGALALPLLTRVAPHVAVRFPAPTARAPEPGASPAAPAMRNTWNTLALTGSSAGTSIDSRRSRAMPEDAAPRPSAGRWIGLAWLVGCLTLLIRIGLGHVGIARLVRRAMPLTGDPWLRLLGDAGRRTRVSAAVRLCRSESVAAPMTWGAAPPVVLLPAGAENWPLERRRAALEHELAHVARRDALTQLVAMLASAVYWFHPLVWLAARRLRIESELACDDRVVTAGTGAADYATHLVAVARAAHQSRYTAGVAVCMARPSHLEGRLRALLDDGRERRTLPKPAGVAAALALMLALVPVAGLRPVMQTAQAKTGSEPAESVFEKTFDVQPGQHLVLDLETGGDIVIHGGDDNRVRVHAELGGDDWRDTRIEAEKDGDDIRVTSRQARHRNHASTSHDFDIRVPKKFDVEIRSAGGGVEISNVEGAFRGHTGGGDIVLESIQGAVRLTTGGGDIRVTDVNATGLVSTGGGMVRLSRVRGGLRGTSGSGPVIHAETLDDDSAPDRSDRDAGDLDAVHVDASGIRDERTGSGGMLDITKAGGNVTLDDAPHGARIQTGGGNIEVRHGKGEIEATTGGGDIAIGPVAGSVSADTGAGDVEVTLSEAETKDQNVEIASGTGRVVVSLPAGFAGRFDLETAYTKDHAVAHIKSDWSVEQDATTEWDDSEGTPRRYVRAHGRAGDGGGVVHIRTVNGDIIVKRSSAAR